MSWGERSVAHAESTVSSARMIVFIQNFIIASSTPTYRTDFDELVAAAWEAVSLGEPPASMAGVGPWLRQSPGDRTKCDRNREAVSPGACAQDGSKRESLHQTRGLAHRSVPGVHQKPLPAASDSHASLPFLAMRWKKAKRRSSDSHGALFDDRPLRRCSPSVQSFIVGGCGVSFPFFPGIITWLPAQMMKMR